MKHVLITGGTRGIGLACVKRYFEAGYAVTALYSSDEEAAEAARARFFGINFVKADVGDERAVEEVFRTLPVLVNNAGISLYKQVQDTSKEEWDRVMAVNAGGTFLCCKHAVKKFLSRGGGAIVNVSSVWGKAGGSCESAYSASKGAVIAFTKALAKELAPAITVNCVLPGVIDTQMNAHLSEEEKKSLIEEIPIGRLGSCDETAEVIFFLGEQKYITGECITVDGGFLL